MNITHEEFKSRIYDVIKDKVFFSNISANRAKVVETMPVEIEHTYNVEKLRAALHDRHHPIASKTDILVDLEYGIVNAYQLDGYYHILTQRLCPNPYFDKYAD